MLAGALLGTGMGLSLYGTLEEGKEAAREGKFAQIQYGMQAKAAEEAGQYESREKRKEGQRKKGAMVAEMSAKGGNITGSNLIGLADTAKEYEADARMIMRNYKGEANRLRNIGAVYAYQGRVARRASRIRALTNLMNPLGLLMLQGKTSSPNMQAAASIGNYWISQPTYL